MNDSTSLIKSNYQNFTKLWEIQEVTSNVEVQGFELNVT